VSDLRLFNFKGQYLNSLIFYIFLWILDNSSFTKVNIRNKAIKEAQLAYTDKDFKESSIQYQLLGSTSFFTPPEVTLNHAHALFEGKDTLQARRKYAQLVSLKEPFLASTTYSQLGIIFCSEKDTARALSLFKEALILKPDNDIARFNYELLKRKYHPRSKQKPETQKPKNNSNTPSPPSQNQQAEVAKDDSQKELLKTLKNYGLTPEKARMILDGMKNSEIQYIQQKQNLVKNKDSGITQNW
jgi:tetratricopeptide (TPR) repeat protein